MGKSAAAGSIRRGFKKSCSMARWMEAEVMSEGHGAIRKLVLLAVLAAVWEAYARWLANPLLFPTFSETVAALVRSITSGQLPRAVSFTITLLLKGYLVGLLLAGVLTAFASATRI